MPFVLTVTPSYVARALRKTLPIMLQDIQEYARRNSDELKTIAQKEKAGYSVDEVTSVKVQSWH
jgi:hypothetical protein